jgi:hypothetical protein
MRLKADSEKTQLLKELEALLQIKILQIKNHIRD